MQTISRMLSLTFGPHTVLWASLLCHLMGFEPLQGNKFFLSAPCLACNEMTLFPCAAIIILINFLCHKRKEMSWTDFLFLFTVRQIFAFQRKILFKTFALPFSLNDFIHTLIFISKSSQQDDIQPFQLLIYPSLYSWEQKYGKILCYTIFNIHFQSFIPQGVVGFFFLVMLLTSEFGTIHCFWSIWWLLLCAWSTFDVNCPNFCFGGGAKLFFFSRQPTWHWIHLEHVAAVIQKPHFFFFFFFHKFFPVWLQ